MKSDIKTIISRYKPFERVDDGINCSDIWKLSQVRVLNTEHMQKTMYFGLCVPINCPRKIIQVFQKIYPVQSDRTEFYYFLIMSHFNFIPKFKFKRHSRLLFTLMLAYFEGEGRVEKTQNFGQKFRKSGKKRGKKLLLTRCFTSPERENQFNQSKKRRSAKGASYDRNGEIQRYIKVKFEYFN